VVAVDMPLMQEVMVVAVEEVVVVKLVLRTQVVGVVLVGTDLD
jgi:hypothetical protein